MDIDSSLKLVTALIVSIFYIPLLLILAKQMKSKRGRKYFYNAILSILSRESDNDKAVEQIHIIFKKLSERNSYINKEYKNTADFCEDLLCRVESYGSKRFKGLYNLEYSNENIDRLVELIKIMKERQPFSSVSSKYGNLLNMIKHAFDTNNNDLGVNNLKQMADDIEVLESTIQSQNKRNQLSIIVSIVGVILTIVFGALSVIQMLSDSAS